MVRKCDYNTKAILGPYIYYEWEFVDLALGPIDDSTIWVLYKTKGFADPQSKKYQPHATLTGSVEKMLLNILFKRHGN